MNTFHINVEYTDTFGGEANYSWVKRENLELPVNLSDRAIMRRAKKAMGLTGVRGKTIVYGDMWEFRPYRSATVMFATVQY